MCQAVEEVAITQSAPDFVLGSDLETAATSAVEMGPASRLLVETDDATRAAFVRRERADSSPRTLRRVLHAHGTSELDVESMVGSSSCAAMLEA